MGVVAPLPIWREKFSARYAGRFFPPQVGDVSAEMIIHALDSLCTSARMTVHVRQLAIGSDVGSSYELVMATGRALGLAFRQCAAIDPRRAGMVTSSKGTLSV